jgi:hypothetical protein
MSISAESGRLLAYHAFDSDVLERVANVAEQQRSSTWEALRGKIPETKIFTPRSGKPIEVLDIIPEDGYESVHVFHLPMGNGFDDNMLLATTTLAAVDPTKRLIAAGNPGAPGQVSGKLRIRDLSTVWSGDMRPTVDSLLQYLTSQRIEGAVHTGGSCGADRAAAAAGYSDKYDHYVSHAVLMEPASVARRSLFALGRSFYQSAAPLEGYVQAAQSKPYIEARRSADTANYGALGAIGLLRPTNVAIAHALAQDGFEARVNAALSTQESMRVDVVWGTDSELCTHKLMLDAVHRLSMAHEKRVRATALKGQRHAMNCDIFLQAALVLQSQKL